MDEKIRICSTCRTQYRYCPKCREFEKLPKWMFAFCSQNCKDIYEVTSSYENGTLSADEAKILLGKLDLNNLLSFGISYQNTIKKINENVSDKINEETVNETNIQEKNYMDFKPKTKKAKILNSDLENI